MKLIQVNLKYLAAGMRYFIKIANYWRLFVVKVLEYISCINK